MRPGESAIDHAACFVHDEADENGERRVVAVPPAAYGGPPRLEVFTTTPGTLADRHAVWTANPTCVKCDAWIDSPDHAGIVPTDTGPRLAHRHVCFAAAMAQHHPLLAIGAALSGVARAPRSSLTP